MTKAVCLISITALSGALSCAAQAQGINGMWSRGDGQARVEIAPCGKDICATNTWIRDSASSEKVGDRLVMTLAPAGPSGVQGEAFDPQRNMRYRIKIVLQSLDTMTTRGCILAGLLCKDVGWTRIR